MDFEQVLKEVVWRLVTEGSVSYRRIKRSFGLDDDALVYGWFTEGFDTADLKEAKALLDKLTEPAIAAEG